jgi:cation transport regulator ChaB
MSIKSKDTKNHEVSVLELAFQSSVDKSKDIIGEKALWQSVIMQAVLDATSNNDDMKSRVEKAKSIAWFSMKNQDFLTVCSFAGMSPDFVIKGFKHALQQNKNSRKTRRTKNTKRLCKVIKNNSNSKVSRLKAVV